MSGVPSIVSDIGGNRDIVHEGYSGFLFTAGNKKEFKEKTMKILNNDSLRLEFSKNAIDFSKKNYSQFSFTKICGFI